MKLFEEIVGVIVQIWPFVLAGLVVILAVVCLAELYIESDYKKAPWEKREAKEAKRRAREEERKRREFWGE